MKTAKQLGITQKEYDALIKVRDWLKNGTIEFVPESALYNGPPVAHDHPNAIKLGFNMLQPAILMRREECGTACCIGGSMYALMKGEIVKDGHVLFDAMQTGAYVWGKQDHKTLGPLFFPPGAMYESGLELEPGDRQFKLMEEITAEEAVRAIDNVLDVGDAKWDEITRLYEVNAAGDLVPVGAAS